MFFVSPAQREGGDDDKQENEDDGMDQMNSETMSKCLTFRTSECMKILCITAFLNLIF